MTSVRQIEANRRNALRSTGPQTDEGKQRASQNAVRHGLTAETVIVPLEDADDYQAFEQAVTADYDGETAVERELVLRLASLLWRLRRATSVETGLLRIAHDPAMDRDPTQETEENQGARLRRYFHAASRPPASPTNAVARVTTRCRPATLSSMWRGASYALPISITAYLSGSAGMRRRFGVR